MGALISAPVACIGGMCASCVGSCAVGALCKCCTCRCLASPFKTNVLYCLILFVATTVALVLRYSEQDMAVDTWSTPGSASYTLCEGGRCEGNWAVFRISFTLSCLFLTMLLLTSSESKAAVFAHRGFWLAKVIGVIAVGATTVFMPNDAFAYYAWIARFVAPGFLVYQVISLIGFGYSANTAMVERDDQAPPAPLLCISNSGGNVWKVANLLLCLLLYVGILTGIGLLYDRFPQSGCSFNPLAVTTTLLLVLLNTALSVSSIAPHAALLTSALVSAYGTWVCYGAMAAMPYAECNPLANSPGFVSSVVSICIATGTVAFLTFSAGRRETAKMSAKEVATNAGQLAPAPAAAPAAADAVTVKVEGEEAREDPLDEVAPQSYRGYYFVMLLLSFYLAMLLSNWGTAADGEADAELLNGSYNASLASAWVQLTSGWLCALLYLWTLVAPRLLPDRDFSV